MRGDGEWGALAIARVSHPSPPRIREGAVISSTNVRRCAAHDDHPGLNNLFSPQSGEGTGWGATVRSAIPLAPLSKQRSIMMAVGMLFSARFDARRERENIPGMNRTDDEWVDELSRATPDGALADLRALLLPGLRMALASYRVTENDVEDFVQDGLLKILDNLASYRGEARFTTWAQKVVVRVALSELRRRRWRDVSLDDLISQHEVTAYTPAALRDTRPDPAQVTMMQMMLATVQRLIHEELTELQRTALLAVMHGGMPLQEVAVRLGTNRNALYKLLHDGRQRLKQRMINEGLAPHELLAMFEER